MMAQCEDSQSPILHRDAAPSHHLNTLTRLLHPPPTPIHILFSRQLHPLRGTSQTTKAIASRPATFPSPNQRARHQTSTMNRPSAAFTPYTCIVLSVFAIVFLAP